MPNKELIEKLEKDYPTLTNEQVASFNKEYFDTLMKSVFLDGILTFKNSKQIKKDMDTTIRKFFISESSFKEAFKDKTVGKEKRPVLTVEDAVKYYRESNQDLFDIQKDIEKNHAEELETHFYKKVDVIKKKIKDIETNIERLEIERLKTEDEQKVFENTELIKHNENLIKTEEQKMVRAREYMYSEFFGGDAEKGLIKPVIDAQNKNESKMKEMEQKRNEFLQKRIKQREIKTLVDFTKNNPLRIGPDHKNVHSLEFEKLIDNLLDDSKGLFSEGTRNRMISYMRDTRRRGNDHIESLANQMQTDCNTYISKLDPNAKLTPQVAQNLKAVNNLKMFITMANNTKIPRTENILWKFNLAQKIFNDQDISKLDGKTVNDMLPDTYIENFDKMLNSKEFADRVAYYEDKFKNFDDRERAIIDELRQKDKLGEEISLEYEKVDSKDFEKPISERIAEIKATQEQLLPKWKNLSTLESIGNRLQTFMATKNALDEIFNPVAITPERRAELAKGLEPERIGIMVRDHQVTEDLTTIHDVGLSTSGHFTTYKPEAGKEAENVIYNPNDKTGQTEAKINESIMSRAKVSINRSVNTYMRDLIIGLEESNIPQLSNKKVADALKNNPTPDLVRIVVNKISKIYGEIDTTRQRNNTLLEKYGKSSDVIMAKSEELSTEWDDKQIDSYKNEIKYFAKQWAKTVKTFSRDSKPAKNVTKILADCLKDFKNNKKIDEKYIKDTFSKLKEQGSAYVDSHKDKNLVGQQANRLKLFKRMYIVEGWAKADVKNPNSSTCQQVKLAEKISNEKMLKDAKKGEDLINNFGKRLNAVLKSEEFAKCVSEIPKGEMMSELKKSGNEALRSFELANVAPIKEHVKQNSEPAPMVM